MERREDSGKTERLDSCHTWVRPKNMACKMTKGSRALESYIWTKETPTKFRWKNNWQNLMFFLGLTLSWTSFITYDSEHLCFISNTPVNFLQVIVIYMIFGCPLVFLETFLGQFAGKSCLSLGQMMPIANGFGYLILVNTFTSSIFNIYVCAVAQFYIFVAVTNFSVPVWMLCLKRYYSITPFCVGREQIDACEPCYSPLAAAQGPCFNPNYNNFSSALFMATVVFDIRKGSTNLLDPPDDKLGVHLAITVLILFITILREIKDLDIPIRVWNLFTVISLIILIVVVFINSQRLQGLLFFLDFSWGSFIDVKCWTHVIHIVIDLLSLSEGGHILFGSFTNTPNTGLHSSFFCASSFAAFILIHIFLFNLTETLTCNLNISSKSISFYDPMAYLLVIYPEALGTLASASVWASLFFLIVFGVSFQAITLQIFIMETAISELLHIPSYRLYTRVLILLAISIASLYLLTPQGAVTASALYCYLNIFRTTIIFLFLIIVFTYGFQRLYDDVYFLLGNPPSSFYKYSWILSLVLMAVATGIYFTHGNFQHNRHAFYTFLVAMLGTLFLGFVVKFVVYLKAKDLSSLLRPAEAWGPSDPATRTVRRLFNPRYEVHFRTLVEKCNHRSLLSSPIHRAVLEAELALLRNTLLDMKNSDQKQKLKRQLVNALCRHECLLSQFLAERAPREVDISRHFTHLPGPESKNRHLCPIGQHQAFHTCHPAKDKE